MKVYLAGPINGCSDSEAKDWRAVTRSQLEAAGHTVVDPMDRDYRGKERGHAHDIVYADMVAIRECDAVLANCWKPSFGTAMEIHYAYVLGRRVLAVAEEPVSPWVDFHAEVCGTVEEACRLLSS